MGREGKERRGDGPFHKFLDPPLCMYI